MEKKWIKTEQMLEALKSEPNVEQQYCHYLGGILRSTHWLEYSSKKTSMVIPQIGLTIRGIRNLSSWKFMLANGG